MHLQGKEAISVVTQRSARTLLATSFAVLAAKYFNVPVGSMSVFGEELPIGVFTVGVPLVMILLAINHCVHWYGDYLSFQNWNVSDGVNKPALVDDEAVIVAKLNGILGFAEQLEDRLRNDSGELSDHQTVAFMDTVTNLSNQVDEIKVSALRLNSFAGFYLYFWQLAFPLLMALLAMVWPTPSLVSG